LPLIIGIIAVMISFSQIFVAGKSYRKLIMVINGQLELNLVIDDVKGNVYEDLEDANVSIKN